MTGRPTNRPLIIGLAVVTALLLTGLLITTIMAVASGRREALALSAIFACPTALFGLPLAYLVVAGRRRAG